MILLLVLTSIWLGALAAFYPLFGLGIHLLALGSGLLVSLTVVFSYSLRIKARSESFPKALARTVEQNSFTVATLYIASFAAALSVGSGVSDALLKLETTPELRFQFAMAKNLTQAPWPGLSVTARYAGDNPPTVTRVTVSPKFYTVDQAGLPTSVDEIGADPDSSAFPVLVEGPIKNATAAYEWRVTHLVEAICTRDEYKGHCVPPRKLDVIDLSIYGRRGRLQGEVMLARRVIQVKVDFR